jgi:hypothetical protein
LVSEVLTAEDELNKIAIIAGGCFFVYFTWPGTVFALESKE